MLDIALLIAALVCFLIAAFGGDVKGVNGVGLGLAFLVIRELIKVL